MLGLYVTDYSRFPPANTPARKTILACISGSVLGAQWSMTLGALFAAVATLKGHKLLDAQLAFVGELAGRGAVAVLMYIVIVVGKLTVTTLNAFGGYMTILTSVSPFIRHLRFVPWVRALRTSSDSLPSPFSSPC